MSKKEIAHEKVEESSKRKVNSCNKRKREEKFLGRTSSAAYDLEAVLSFFFGKVHNLFCVLNKIVSLSLLSFYSEISVSFFYFVYMRVLFEYKNPATLDIKLQ